MTLPSPSYQGTQEGEVKRDLSTPMWAALCYAKQVGGLVRQPGGFWVAPADADNWTYGRVTYGTKTVQALVTRGHLEYTEHKEGRNGRFPVRAEVSRPHSETQQPSDGGKA